MEKRRLELLEIPLNRDVFLRDLVRGLTGALEEVVGVEKARGFVSLVGQRIGDQMNQDYQSALGHSPLDASTVGAVLVDLKRRIQGDFAIEEMHADRMVLSNTACPFEDRVKGRPSMCMMTSNVFGTIAAENLGYARVVLEETIAEGASGCRVVVHFQPPDVSPPAASDGHVREYFAEG